MNIQEAKKWLKQAIERHQRHMDGKEPITGPEGEKSQMTMMEEMKKAYSFLGDDSPEIKMKNM